jgi:hypothetical protein
VGIGFRIRSCPSNNLEQDDESKRRHPVLGVETRRRSGPEGGVERDFSLPSGGDVL